MNAPTTAAPPRRAAPPARAPVTSSAPTPAPATQQAAPKLGKLQPAFQAPRIILNAVEGWGKTSAVAFAPTPAILMAKGETGYQTLLGAGLVPSVDAVLIETWQELLAVLDALATEQGHQTVALDALGGFERLCHQYTCDTRFDGEWGDKGFGSYQKGYDLAINDWLGLLTRLDKIQQQGVAIVLLSHCKIKTFKSPDTPDYDRWVADLHDKTWAITAKWADAVLFGNFFVDVKGGAMAGITGDKAKKGKAQGSTQRVLFSERRATFDAKNRYGMKPELDIPDDPSQIWPTLWAAITNGKAQ